MNEVILFNHMTKSGGTSLRFALMKTYPACRVLFAYNRSGTGAFRDRDLIGEVAEETLEQKGWDAHDRLYNNYLETNPGIDLIFGHRAPAVGSLKSREVRAFTMMRHPYTRYVSLYNHRVHHDDEKRSFEDWIKNNHEVRAFMRERSLEDIKEELRKYERIFFFEHYDQEMAELGKILNITLDVVNVNPTPKAVKRSTETDKLIAEFAPLKIELYNFLYEKFR